MHFIKCQCHHCDEHFFQVKEKGQTAKWLCTVHAAALRAYPAALLIEATAELDEFRDKGGKPS